jgi:hypothetical protein
MSNLSYGARKLLSKRAEAASDTVRAHGNPAVDGVYEAVHQDEKVELLCEALSNTRLCEEYREDVEEGIGDVEAQRHVRDAERSLRDALDARIHAVKEAEIQRLSALGHIDTDTDEEASA